MQVGDRHNGAHGANLSVPRQVRKRASATDRAQAASSIRSVVGAARKAATVRTETKGLGFGDHEAAERPGRRAQAQSWLYSLTERSVEFGVQGFRALDHCELDRHAIFKVAHDLTAHGAQSNLHPHGRLDLNLDGGARE